VSGDVQSRRDGAAEFVGSIPNAYERWLVPALFGPYAADLSRRVAAFRPPTVLELAAGTEIEARGELEAIVDAATRIVARRLGTGPVHGEKAAYVVTAVPG
jgi:hypothetical protein